MRVAFAASVLLALSLVIGCDGKSESGAAAAPGAGLPKVKLALNWVPEPEFGGIYAAQQIGAFRNNGLDVDILPGGAGAPTWQLVGSGQVQFAVASGDEVVIARTRGADIVGLFTIYQDCPQAIMTHEERGLQNLADVFRGGTLAIEKGLAYGKFLERKYGFGDVKLVSYDGGIAAFLADKNYAQQCFVFSEPLAARRQGAKVKTFLIAESGYNPYTGVVIAKADFVKQNKPLSDAMVKSLREGWKAYLQDPRPANDLMGTLNKTMDAQTFAEAAEAQKPLVLPKGMNPEQLGTMTLDRWQQLVKQLRELKVIESDIDPAACFVQ